MQPKFSWCIAGIMNRRSVLPGVRSSTPSAHNRPDETTPGTILVTSWCRGVPLCVQSLKARAKSRELARTDPRNDAEAPPTPFGLLN